MIFGNEERQKTSIFEYYYKNKENMQGFLCDKDGSVVPIEVKPKNGSSVSLNEYIKKYNPKIAYKFIDGNVGFDGAKYTLPFYMGVFL